MKLSHLNRLSIVNMLPREGKGLRMVVVISIKDMVKLTAAEQESIEWYEHVVDGRVITTFNIDKAETTIADKGFELTDKQRAMVIELLERADRGGKYNEQHVRLGVLFNPQLEELDPISDEEEVDTQAE